MLKSLLISIKATPHRSIRVKHCVKKLHKETEIYGRKNHFTLLNVNIPDVREKRKNWFKNLSVFDRDKLVFLDESSVNINMTRGYGRSMRGTRCTDKAPLSRHKSTTILSSVRLNGGDISRRDNQGKICRLSKRYSDSNTT